MTNTKRRTRTRRALITLSALALTSLLFTCAEVPDFCGTGEIYDPTCQFCYGSRAYPKCKNGKYNPLTAGCDKDTLVGTRCSNDSIVPLGTPCGGYTLIFASAPETGGKLEPLTPPDNGLTYDAKQTVLLQASANADYKFAGWAGAQPAERFKDEATVTAEYVTSGNMPKVTIVAMFKPIGKGKLVTDVFPKSPALGGSVSRNKPEPEDGYKDGEQVIVTAHPAEGFAFAGWSGADSSKNNSIVVTMGESKTLVAMFTPVLYSLKVNSSPAGGGAVFIDGTPFGGGAYQDVGTKIITVWAKGNEGYEFTRWSGTHARFDDETSVTTTVTLDADAEITAIFKSGGGGGGSSSSGGPALLCTLKVNINPEDGGSVLLDPPSGICRLGEYVTATVMPNEGEGFSFTGWSGDTLSASNPVMVHMGRNKTVTANFRSNGDVVGPPTGGVSDSTFIDERDGAVYKKVKINNQTWMAENLNYNKVGESWCYGEGGKAYVLNEATGNYEEKTLSSSEVQANCKKYGRLYTWASAMDLDASYNNKPWNSTARRQGICPSGWHLPTNAEWGTLVDFVGSLSGTKLKAGDGWYNYSTGVPEGNGTDNFGFSALPGGNRNLGGSFINAGSYGLWWAATEYSDGDAYHRGMSYDYDDVGSGDYDMEYGFAVRCVENE